MRSFRHVGLALFLISALAISARAQDDPNAPIGHIDEVLDLQIVGASAGASAGPADIETRSLFLSHPIQLGSYLDIYPGIDVVSYGDEYCFEYVFILHPGADPDLIGLMFDHGYIEQMSPEGHIIHQADQVEVQQRSPIGYSIREDGTFDLPVRYRLGGGNLVQLDVSDAMRWNYEALNRTRFNLVKGGGQPGGPTHDFYISRFEVSNDQFLRFLNAAQENPKTAMGANMFFDDRGNVWFSPEMRPDRDEMFLIANSRLVYDPDQSVGSRYQHVAIGDTMPFADHPVVGVSWYGAVKYCNWLTILAGRGESERCYREGTNALAWHPVTATNWIAGEFSPAERERWIELKGFRLPMLQDDIDAINTNRYNEAFKVAAWHGNTNIAYAFGRTNATPSDANYKDTRALTGTTPVGFFDGRNYLGDVRTSANANFFGVHDLTGNAGEWLNDFAHPSNSATRAVYGGTYVDPVFTTQNAQELPPHACPYSGGFRPITTFQSDERLVIHLPYCFHVGGTGVVEKVEEGLPEKEEAKPGEEEIRRLELLDIERTEGLLYRPLPPPPPGPEVRPPRPGGGGGGIIPTPTPGPTPANPRILRTESVNPSSDVRVIITPGDFMGRADGDTTFDRIYNAGTIVTLTAPNEAPNGNIFQYWLRDGAFYSGSHSVTIVMDYDTTMTAVYAPGPPITHTVTVESRNPDGNVSILVTPNDIFGESTGSTTFEREYNHGSLVTFTAPPMADGNYFQYWLVDGVEYSANSQISLIITADTTVTAVYGPEPPIVRELIVNSTDPDSGVTIGVTPTDIADLANGSTEFSRHYSDGTTVTLSAPETAPNGNIFQYWERDGVLYSANRNVDVLMDSDVEMTAVYGPEAPLTHTLTVRSRDPDSGVGIIIDPRDNNDLDNGVTEFERIYNDGTTVTLIAPETAPNGNIFQYWERDGEFYSGNREVTVDMFSDVEMTAVYGPEAPNQYRLTVQSQNPNSGVGITVSPSDNSGFASGTTGFDRFYNEGVTVTITAPDVAPNGYFFQYWMVNGVIYSGSLSIDILMTADTVVTAVYGPTAPEEVVLIVDSRNPDSGVAITVTPNDKDNLGDGTTGFERTYNRGTDVTLEAPEMAGTNYFQYWEQDGDYYDNNRQISVTLTNDTTHMTAVYGPEAPTYTLTVESTDPDSGVQISVTPNDNDNLGDGTTTFQREYNPGVVVTLVAPEIVMVGPVINYFQYWIVDGVQIPRETDPTTLMITMNHDTVVVAVYSETEVSPKGL